MSTCKYTESVEKWGTFEAEMPGKHEGNPFTDYAIQGTFKGKEETKTVDGFYDGDGIYRVRFMPSFEGDYTFEIKGSFSDEVYTGAFHVTPAAEGNHDRSVYPTPIIWHMKMENLIIPSEQHAMCGNFRARSFRNRHWRHWQTVHLIRSVSVYSRNIMTTT